MREEASASGGGRDRFLHPWPGCAGFGDGVGGGGFPRRIFGAPRRGGAPGPGGLTFQYFSLSTGRSKSLAQVQALFADAFGRAAAAPAGAELAKLGDIRFGGEVRVVSLGGGGVELAYNPAMSSGNPRLTPGEAAAFAQILR